MFEWVIKVGLRVYRVQKDDDAAKILANAPLDAVVEIDMVPVK